MEHRMRWALDQIADGNLTSPMYLARWALQAGRIPTEVRAKIDAAYSETFTLEEAS